MKPEELRHQMRTLGNQELRLQGTALALVLATGVALLIAALPHWRASLGLYRWKEWYLPLLCLVCIAGSVHFSLNARKKRNLIFDARKQLAGQVGAKDLSLVDPLTGLLNQQYLDQRVSKEIRWVERIPEISLTLVMLELNGFRSLGHSTGDRVLEGFAELLKKNFRGSDTLIRYGKDEFVVLMLGVREQKAQMVVERLYEMADRWNSEHPIKGYKLAFHWGLITYSKGAQIGNLLETAHQRMGQQKAQQGSAS